MSRMNVEVSAHPGSASQEGPLINGRPALTIEDVQSWCHAASMPGLCGPAATEIARELNNAALFRTLWAPSLLNYEKRIRRQSVCTALQAPLLPCVMTCPAC